MSVVRGVAATPSPSPLPHQHVGPLGTVTCYATHSEPPHDLVPRNPSRAEQALLDALARHDANEVKDLASFVQGYMAAKREIGAASPEPAWDVETLAGALSVQLDYLIRPKPKAKWWRNLASAVLDECARPIESKP
jgi:hypothetical protein